MKSITKNTNGYYIEAVIFNPETAEATKDTAFIITNDRTEKAEKKAYIEGLEIMRRRHGEKPMSVKSSPKFASCVIPCEDFNFTIVDEWHDRSRAEAETEAETEAEAEDDIK